MLKSRFTTRGGSTESWRSVTSERCGLSVFFSPMSSFHMLSLAVVRAAGELDVVVCLLLFKHDDLPQKIHTYILEKNRKAKARSKQEAVCGRSERCSQA